MSDLYNINETKKNDMHANRFTQIGVGLLAVIIGLAIIVNVTAPMYVSSMVKDAGLSTAISHRLMDTVFESLGDNTEALSQIQTDIENSQIIDRLAQKYTSAMVTGMIDNKAFDDVDVDISSELDELADMTYNKIAEYINMGDIQKAIVRAALSYSETSAKQAIDNYVEGIYNNIYNRLGTLIKVYRIITSMSFKIVMIILYVTAFVIIIVTNPVKTVRYTLPCIFIITGVIYMLLANVLGNRYVVNISNRYLGRSVFIDSQIAYKVLGVMCICAVVSLILSIVCGVIKNAVDKR